MQVLAGDIGGTKTLLTLAAVDARGRATVTHERRFDSAAYAGLAPMIGEFLDAVGDGRPDGACLAVAGPVSESTDGQRARLTNLPWDVDSRQLAQTAGIAHLRIINDFQAVGYGIDALTDADLATLQAGDAQTGAPCAVIGAGTGLGQGIRIRHGDHYQVLATEGGHVDFAPTDDDQIELLRWLRAHHGRVSYERILSGPGLADIHRCLCERAGLPDSRLDVARDPAAAVSAAALSGQDVLARQALDMFMAIYGAQAGNLALTVLARGGVYVAGGIAPRLVDQLRAGPFMAAFLDKGRMRPLLEAMPVQVIINPQVGLLGAVRVAARLAVQ